MSDPTETRLRETYGDVTPPPEMRDEILDALPEIPREAPASTRRPIRFLAVAAAAAVLVVAAVLLSLPAGESPVDEGRGAAAQGPGARELLGDQLWNELGAIPGGMARLRHLLTHDFERDPPGPRAGRELADLVLAAFPWRETYVDAEHQKDLFAIKELAESEGLGDAWAWLFVRMASHSHPYVRLHGVQRLRDIRGRSHGAEVALARAIGDEDSNVRTSAVLAIVDLDLRDHRAAVLARLGQTEPRSRATMVRALAAWNDPETRATIVRTLEDDAYRVRSAAATALEIQGAKDALPALRAARKREKHGDVARVLDSTIRSLMALRGLRRPVKALGAWTGADGRATEPEYWIVGAPEVLAEEWRRHRGADPTPEVDFDRSYVLGVCAGPGWNSRGYDAIVTRDDARVTIRLQQRYYQTMGKADRVNAYLFLVLPLVKKPVVIEENVQGTIGGDPIWKELVVLDPW